MNKAEFVYVTYIATTPEKAWRAIVDPEMAAQYWNGLKADHPAHVNVSDWKAGSRWEHQRVDSRETAIAGKVLEIDPPRRLVLSWGRPGNDERKPSRLTMELEPMGQVVKLTVTHEGFETDADMLQGISEGWPVVLANMKTFLESGRSLRP
jgi:uncharacterized protein YndB with AHSA1/START domain